MLLRVLSLLIAGFIFFKWYNSKDRGRRLLAWIAGVWLLVSFLTILLVYANAFGY